MKQLIAKTKGTTQTTWESEHFPVLQLHCETVCPSYRERAYFKGFKKLKQHKQTKQKTFNLEKPEDLHAR